MIVLVFLVNGTPGSPMGIRAGEFAKRLSDAFEPHILYRSADKVRSIWTFLHFLRRIQPDVCYVLDMGYSGVLAACLYRVISRCRIVVDTGDVIFELARSMGRGPLGLALTKVLEFIALRISHRLVVRSHFHKMWLEHRGFTADVIPDGVDTVQFCRMDVSDLRRAYGLEGFITIGVLGSAIWNERSQSCYGWDVIEVIRRLRDQPVMGVIVGDGSGIPHLKALCAEYAISERILFLGRIPYQDLPPILNLMDICLSTQTNDSVGKVRTTGKLPLYLGCGRHVLASDVGEASRVLPSCMLIPNEGIIDEEYSEKLVSRITTLLNTRDLLESGKASIEIAKRHFDYNVLVGHLQRTIRNIL